MNLNTNDYEVKKLPDTNNVENIFATCNHLALNENQNKDQITNKVI
jgi:hypothetical protein